MVCAQQGDILWLEKEAQHVLVLSREFFNRSGMSVVCPLRDYAKPDALHIGITSEAYTGMALIEHLRSLDLEACTTEKFPVFHMSRFRIFPMPYRGFSITIRIRYKIYAGTAE